MSADGLLRLKNKLQAFAGDRDWDQFHSPKNLAMALSVEAAELVEIFQWLSEEQSKKLSKEQLDRARMEIADVFIYLLRIADKLNVDIVDAAEQKIAINERKYPAEVVRGRAQKYTDYE